MGKSNSLWTFSVDESRRFVTVQKDEDSATDAPFSGQVLKVPFKETCYATKKFLMDLILSFALENGAEDNYLVCLCLHDKTKFFRDVSAVSAGNRANIDRALSRPPRQAVLSSGLARPNSAPVAADSPSPAGPPQPRKRFSGSLLDKMMSTLRDEMSAIDTSGTSDSESDSAKNLHDGQLVLSPVSSRSGSRGPSPPASPVPTPVAPTTASSFKLKPYSSIVKTALPPKPRNVMMAHQPPVPDAAAKCDKEAQTEGLESSKKAQRPEEHAEFAVRSNTYNAYKKNYYASIIFSNSFTGDKFEDYVAHEPTMRTIAERLVTCFTFLNIV